MRKTDIIFIRHGESANNVTYHTVLEMFGDSLSPEQYEIELGKLHSPDCALSPKGVKQVEQLCKYLESGGLSRTVPDLNNWKLFSSPMNRCLLTAKGISDTLKKRVAVMPFLFESDGCYESLPDKQTRGLPGSTAAEVREKYPMFDCAPGMEEGYYHHPRKETRRQFLARSQEVCNWLWTLHDQSAEERGFKTGMIVIAHGNLIQSIISQLVDSKNMMITHHNTGFAHVQLWSNEDGSGRLPAILFSNRVDHLHGHPELIGGGAVVEDHWIQEFMEPMDG